MPLHVVTPVWDSQPLSGAAGSQVLLKMDALQPVGSFKIRGIGRACEESVKSGAIRLICSSGGNAGYAVAYAGRKLEASVSVYVPRTTPEYTREVIRRENAEVIEHGEFWDETHLFASDSAAKEGAGYIHPFDDPRVWDGHATIIEEVAEVGTKPGVVVVAVGGGGLLCGVLEGLHRAGWEDVPVLAVETEGAASFAASAKAGRLVTLDRIDSIATTLGARTVTHKALEWTNHHTITPWMVTDREALEACQRFADDHRLLVEPACGAALAAVYGRAEPVIGKAPILVIVCGGAGVSLQLLEKWKAHVGS